VSTEANQSQSLRVIHVHDESVSVEHDGIRLLRYVYRPEGDAREAPKPYIHPLRTLAGDIVTGYRPHDHRWHKGLQLTGSHVSGENFWGGGTYVHERGGYTDLDNVGSIRSQDLEVATAPDGSVHLAERLVWLNSRGVPWVSEQREIAVCDVDADAGCWVLDWRSSLTGLRAEPLRFGSPTTHGRPNAGYSGLFWRGPRDFAGGTVLGPEGTAGVGGASMMGKQACWLAFCGTHDEVDRSSTLVFVPERDAPGTPPTHWFVRTGDHPMVNPSWAFYDEFELAAGAVLIRGYRLIVASGAWGQGQIDRYVAELTARPATGWARGRHG
jgi:hypothetical protein